MFPFPQKGGVIVFDMDGVLVDVTASYRAAIQQTVEYFTGQQISPELIQAYKNRGGWNNDWALSQQIARDLGVEIDYQTVVTKFQEFFLGANGDGQGGLIERERWLPQPGLLESLAARHQLAIFTGRVRKELEITLRRFAPDIAFDPIICSEDVTEDKPSPEGLLRIRQGCPGRPICYLGDSVDDARSARAAGVPFIGIVSPARPRRDELLRLFRELGAVAILSSVNELGEVIGE